MEITMDDYEATIGQKYVTLSDIEAILEDGNNNWHWYRRTLWPTHGDVHSYRETTYRQEGEKYILYSSGYERNARLLAKINGRYYKLNDCEISKARLAHVNSFIDKLGGFHLTMKQWKQIPLMKPFMLRADGKTIEYLELAPDVNECDELPFY